MNQSELPFAAHKLARASDPETSKAAARQCKELRGEHHRAILEQMRKPIFGSGVTSDWTCDELAAYIGTLDRVQIGKRMHELERAGLVRKTGETRPTASGRAACCYEVCS